MKLTEKYFWITAILVLLLDQGSKIWVRKFIPIGKEIPLIPHVFSITHIRNSGAVFGTLEGATTILTILSVFAVFLIVYIEKTVNFPLKEIAFGMILGGILGNFFDRLIFKNVTDFLFLHHFAVFNVADASIDIGIVIFLYAYLRYGQRV
jgi:signal peptidase II